MKKWMAMAAALAFSGSFVKKRKGKLVKL